LVHAFNHPPDDADWSADDARLTAALKASPSESAQALVEIASQVRSAESASDSADGVLVVIKRRGR
jgi:hypothetical protein